MNHFGSTAALLRVGVFDGGTEPIMTESNTNVEQDTTRESLVSNVTATKQAYDAARLALKSYDETHNRPGSVYEKRQSTRRASGIPSIEDALVTVIRENGNQPMQAQQVYEALVKRTEWAYKSKDLAEYVRYTLSGRSKIITKEEKDLGKPPQIFDRPHVNIGGKIQKRGWYSVLADYQTKSTSAPRVTLSRPKTSTSTTADTILNTELTLGTNQNPFKPAEETA
jgi:hypothetical protein